MYLLLKYKAIITDHHHQTIIFSYLKTIKNSKQFSNKEKVRLHVNKTKGINTPKEYLVPYFVYITQ